MNLPTQRPAFDRWRERVEGQKVAFLWAVAAIAGALSISLAPPEQARRLVLPMLVMFAYALAGYRHTKAAGSQPALRATRVAQLADSLYFLGFLWTLWALIDSFVFRRMSGAEGVFNVFGYALVTTATGMFLRLLLLQFRYGAREQEGEAQLRVEEQLARLAEQVSETVAALDTFRESTRESARSLVRGCERLEKNVDTVNRRTEELENVIARTHEEGMRRLNESFERAMQRFVDGLLPPFAALHHANTDFATQVANSTENVKTTLAASSDASAKAMQTAANAVARELTSVAQQVGAIRIPSDVTAKTEDLLGRVREVDDALRVLATTIADGDVREAVRTLSGSIRAAGIAAGIDMEDFAARVQRIRVPEDVVERLHSFDQSVTNLEGTLKRLEGAVSAHSTGFDAGWAEVENVLREFARKVSVVRMPEDVTFNMEVLAERVVELEAALQQLSRAMKALSKDSEWGSIRVMRTSA